MIRELVETKLLTDNIAVSLRKNLEFETRNEITFDWRVISKKNANGASTGVGLLTAKQRFLISEKNKRKISAYF
jgi:hypothetical protein